MNGQRLQDLVMWTLCGLALALVIVPTIDIIVGIVSYGIGGWSLTLLTTPTSGIAGGLLNAWTGTLLLMALLLLIAGPIGILAGIYLAEYASPADARWLRFASEVLAGTPSIVVGYVTYLVLVIGLGWSFSVLAGVIALTIFVLPYIIKSTEAAFRQVPTAFREGGMALGLPRYLTLWVVLLPLATPSIMTGLIVSEAVAMGETAPLLYTAGWSNALPNLQLVHRPVGYLTYVVWTYINEPYAQAHQLAYSAAGMLVVFLLLLILLGRLISARSSRFTGRFQT
jgi:phosphate transport system permease protein